MASGLIAHWFIRGDDAEGMGRIVIFIIMRHIHKGHLAAAVGCGQHNYLLTIFPMFFNSMDKVPSGLLMKRIKSVFSIYSDGKGNFNARIGFYFYDCGRLSGRIPFR